MATLNALTRKYLKLSKTELREELGRRGLIGFRYRFYPTAAEVVIEDEYSMAMLIAKDDQKKYVHAYLAFCSISLHEYFHSISIANSEQLSSTRIFKADRFHFQSSTFSLPAPAS